MNDTEILEVTVNEFLKSRGLVVVNKEEFSRLKSSSEELTNPEVLKSDIEKEIDLNSPFFREALKNYFNSSSPCMLYLLRNTKSKFVFRLLEGGILTDSALANLSTDEIKEFIGSGWKKDLKDCFGVLVKKGFKPKWRL